MGIRKTLSVLRPLVWLKTIRDLYLSKRIFRQWTVNIVGAALILWFASFYINWIQPALTPADLFPPEFTGPVAVKARLVDEGPVVNVSTYTGRIEPYQTNDIFARVDGFVERMPVYEGDFVEQGQVLAQLELSSILPQLKKALADSAFLNAEMERSTLLFQDGVISPSEFDRAKKMYEQAVAQVELMRATVSYATIRSGISGYVAERHVYPGQYVKKGQKLFQVARLDSVRIKFKVSEEDLVLIQPHDPVWLEFPQLSSLLFRGSKERQDRIGFLPENNPIRIWSRNTSSVHESPASPLAAESKVPGLLVQEAIVFPSEDPVTRTGTVEVRLMNAGMLLKGNGYAVGKFAVTHVDSAVRVPSQAIVSTPDGKSVVFVAPALTDQGFADQREVTVGLTSPAYTQVVAGIDPGEYVVYSGMKTLVDGQSVLVVERRQ